LHQRLDHLAELQQEHGPLLLELVLDALPVVCDGAQRLGVPLLLLRAELAQLLLLVWPPQGWLEGTLVKLL
jgi:hypothetical protein